MLILHLKKEKLNMKGHMVIIWQQNMLNLSKGARTWDKYIYWGLFIHCKRFTCFPNVNAAAAKSLWLCPTLCDPIDGSPPGSPVPGILQARTLEWVAISFSNAWKWKGKVKSLSHVQLLVTSWTVAQQAPPSMRFSRQEYWSGCHRLLPLLTGMTKKEVKIRKVTTIH